jgi:hypothetical protein
MERITLDRQTHNLLDRIRENLGDIAAELERLNENLEDDDG